MAREDKESTHEEIGSSAESFTGTVNTGGGATYFGTRILPYPDSSTVSELQLRIRTPVVSGFSYGSEMHVCTLTHSGLLHASGLSAVSWLTAWVDLEIQVRAYLSTTAVLRAY